MKEEKDYIEIERNREKNLYQMKKLKKL
jgi:hypothetical protein